MTVTHSDPGLQPERTTLSWTRTSISLAVVSMILTRWSRVYGPWVFALITLLVLLAATIYFTQQSRYQSGVRGIVDEAAPASIGSVLTLTAAMLIFGAGGLLLILAPE